MHDIEKHKETSKGIRLIADNNDHMERPGKHQLEENEWLVSGLSDPGISNIVGFSPMALVSLTSGTGKGVHRGEKR